MRPICCGENSPWVAGGRAKQAGEGVGGQSAVWHQWLEVPIFTHTAAAATTTIELAAEEAG